MPRVSYVRMVNIYEVTFMLRGVFTKGAVGMKKPTG